MPGIPLTYHGVVFSLEHETRGWVARIPRFGKTMYFASQDEAIDEAMRLVDAFVVPRVIRLTASAALL